MITLDLSLENFYRQYYACRRNKRNTINALRFEAEQEKNLITLREALLTRTYQPRRSVCFFTTRPKFREIIAADFQDRVVHHLLVDYLEQIWEPIFIHDSYACRRGKGVHKGVKRLQQFIRQAGDNGCKPVWYLQLDIKNYFLNIDRDVLLRLLFAKCPDESAQWLTQLLVYHDVTKDCYFKGRRDLQEKIPAHKTMFGAAENKGLPIGNLNSQFFANVYLNSLDQFVKHELKCKFYLRYCDDFVLLANDADTLRDWQVQIEQYLHQELKLTLNPKQRLARVSDGVDFLGYIVRKDYMLVRRRVVHNLKLKLGEFEKQLVIEKHGVRCYRFDQTLLDKLAAVLSSYLGHLKQANSWRLVHSLWQKFSYLSHYFEFDENKWRLERKYSVPRIKQVRKQYRYFRWRFPQDIVFIRVGKFIEFYDIITPHWLACLGLKAMGWNRRGARYGFPLTQLWHKLADLLFQEYSVLIITERTNVTGGIRQRVPICRFCLASG